MKRLLILFFVCFLMFGCVIASNSNGQLTTIFSYPEGVSGDAFVNNSNDSILINYNKGKDRGMYLFKGGKVVKCIRNTSTGILSPNGNLYAFTNENILVLCDKKDKVLYRYPMNTRFLTSVSWSCDSNLLYICLLEKNVNIYKIDIKTGKKDVIVNNGYYYPVAVKDNSILYFLQDKNLNDVASDCNIVKYNLKTKKSEIVKIPDPKLRVYEDFTISPDEKTLIFRARGGNKICVVNIPEQKIIGKFTVPGFDSCPDIGSYSWKLDSSYVIFAYSSSKEYGICKYVLPKR